MDATSRDFLFGLLTLFDLRVWCFPEHLVWSKGFWGLRHLRWFYYHHSQWDYWAHLIFSLISLFKSNLAHYLNLEHYWLLEFHFLFASDLYLLHYFECFKPGHYLHHYLHYDWDFFFTLVLGILFPTVLFTLALGTLLNTYFGKPFPPGGFSATNTEGGFLGTLPFGLGCALGTTFGIPVSYSSFYHHLV